MKSSRHIDFPAIPTGISRNETEALRALAKDKVVLEIGSLLGYSTVVMAQVAKEVHAIDKHTGYPDHDPRPTAPAYFHNLMYYKVMDKVFSYIGVAERFLDNFGDVLPEFIFLDLDGHYENTKKMLKTFVGGFSSWLEGDGDNLVTLALHDYGHPDWPGVKKAADEVLKSCSETYDIEVVDTLLLIRLHPWWEDDE